MPIACQWSEPRPRQQRQQRSLPRPRSGPSTPSTTFRSLLTCRNLRSHPACGALQDDAAPSSTAVGSRQASAEELASPSRKDQRSVSAAPGSPDAEAPATPGGGEDLDLDVDLDDDDLDKLAEDDPELDAYLQVCGNGQEGRRREVAAPGELES